jgi:alpha-beta hydrolase superfamily lysophospholipase
MWIKTRERVVCAAACRHAIVMGVVLASPAVGVGTAEASDKVTVRVRLENAADVPTRILDGAQFDTSRIYRDAGIEIIWLNHDDRECCDPAASSAWSCPR